MSDPNRIFHRVESLLLTARSAIEEAETIYEGAIEDEADEEVLDSTHDLIVSFYAAIEGGSP